MKSAILWVFILALSPCLAQAQSSAYSKGHGYAFFGAGGQAGGYNGGGADFHVGGGFESFFKHHLGAGAEIGYAGGAGGRGYGSAILSPNFVARFFHHENKDKGESFVTGGYTLFRHGVTEYFPTGPFGDYQPFKVQRFESGFNLGGGANWWFNEHAGLRFEIRDYISVSDSHGVTHFAGVHIGVTFR